jgi:aldehyde dehydrogenase (NAD+)
MDSFQDLFERQKRHFAMGVTRSFAWRIEQLDRMARFIGENEAALQRAVGQDFKTASQEQVFETLACLGEVAFQKSQLKDWMAPTEARVPRALAATGHRGIVYRDHLFPPYSAEKKRGVEDVVRILNQKEIAR